MTVFHVEKQLPLYLWLCSPWKCSLISCLHWQTTECQQNARYPQCVGLCRLTHLNGCHYCHRPLFDETNPSFINILLQIGYFCGLHKLPPNAGRISLRFRCVQVQHSSNSPWWGYYHLFLSTPFGLCLLCCNFFVIWCLEKCVIHSCISA